MAEKMRLDKYLTETGIFPSRSVAQEAIAAGKVSVNGKTVTRYVIMGVCEARDGNVSILALHPYSVLQVKAADIAAAGP